MGGNVKEGREDLGAIKESEGEEVEEEERQVERDGIRVERSEKHGEAEGKKGEARGIRRHFDYDTKSVDKVRPQQHYAVRTLLKDLVAGPVPDDCPVFRLPVRRQPRGNVH